jgi:hypothetical protein
VPSQSCRMLPVEVAHIEPWSKVKLHEFANLIALCPTCHALQERGLIDRKATRRFKANLGIINARYGEYERRLLEFSQFASVSTLRRSRSPGPAAERRRWPSVSPPRQHPTRLRKLGLHFGGSSRTAYRTWSNCRTGWSSYYPD